MGPSRLLLLDVPAKIVLVQSLHHNQSTSIQRSTGTARGHCSVPPLVHGFAFAGIGLTDIDRIVTEHHVWMLPRSPATWRRCNPPSASSRLPLILAINLRINLNGVSKERLIPLRI